VSELADPLAVLRDELDQVTLPVAVAALAQRADQAIRELGARIAHETRRKAPCQLDDPTEKPRPVQRLRAGDVATVTTVHTEREWEELKEKVDQRVRQLLAEGYDVEVL